MASNKEVILDLLHLVNRRNMTGLIRYIEHETDYFTAPASTKYHEAYKGGLASHSLNVYSYICDLVKLPQFKDKGFTDETLVVISLLHDLCKTNFYKEELRNKKDENGNWIQVPTYIVEDSHSYGHGECSVMLIENHIRLSEEERYAIRWHMAGFDRTALGGDISIVSRVYAKYPLAVLLNMADMLATYVQ